MVRLNGGKGVGKWSESGGDWKSLNFISYWWWGEIIYYKIFLGNLLAEMKNVDLLLAGYLPVNNFSTVVFNSAIR